MSDIEKKKQALLRIIKEKVVVKSDEADIVSNLGKKLENGWILDFRNIFLDPEALDIIVDIFWEKFEKDYPFQVGGQEIAAVPVVGAIVHHSQKMGKPVNGFIIRKSRKPSGMQKIIEGNVNNEKIILIDDLMHTGTTINRQLKVLEYAGKNVTDFFVLVNYKGKESEDLLLRKNVRLNSVFSLSDIGIKLRIKNNLRLGFGQIWKFSSPNPIFFHRVHKSTPAMDENKLYFGTDNMCFWALNQKDGSVAWKFDQFGYPTSDGKAIFSSPAILGDIIFFGSYDGNVYALDKVTGKLRWKYMDADFVGSSPAVSEDLKMVFIGLEFGIFKRKGGIVALGAESGKKVWEQKMEKFVHSSPIYIPEKKAVAIGCNDSCVYLFRAKDGKMLWKQKIGGLIKSSFDFDLERNLLFFGSFDNNLYALDLDSGNVKGKFPARQPIFSVPLVHENKVYFGSMDKYLYCIDLDSGKMEWRFDVGGRIFARPKMINGKIYVGSTNGIFYEINKETGKPISHFIATERITNDVAYNEKTDFFFLPTYANEIYCLKKLES